MSKNKLIHVIWLIIDVLNSIAKKSLQFPNKSMLWIKLAMAWWWFTQRSEIVVMQDQAFRCCDWQTSTLDFGHSTRSWCTRLADSAIAPCRPEQQRWPRKTYVSVLPFVLAPFGLLQSRFDLHPATHEINAGGESQKCVERGLLNPIIILMK